ncbi:MAG TPA: response regulator [Mycobacteriales bacterium]|nr:response regulator [Mycobacteriales bacterium]
MTRVLIVDDHDSYRATARRLLESEGFEVVGESPDGETAVADAERLHPAVVLLDVQLPDIDGFEVARRLAALDDPPVVVLCSSREAVDYGSKVKAAAVSGFISKAELSGARLAKVVASDF